MTFRVPSATGELFRNVRPAYLLFFVALPVFGNISFSCASNIDATQAGTCAALNGSLSQIYSGTFTNANASIYIQYGTTGLGASQQFFTTVSYSSYYNALASHETDANDVTAVASLGGVPASGNGGNPVVSGEGVAVTSALAAALGLSGGIGITIGGSSCTLGTSNCFNTLITISNSASLYYGTGTQTSGQYNFFSVVQHEVDEALGTSSCLVTASGVPAQGVGCTNGGQGVAAADLFRYASQGTRSYLSTANGSIAYFSINGGKTNIAGYNNLPNSADYGDWDSSVLRVQNAFGTPGTSPSITNDGGAEIAVLDAVGYSLIQVPEPSTIALTGLALAGMVRRSRTTSSPQAEQDPQAAPLA